MSVLILIHLHQFDFVLLPQPVLFLHFLSPAVPQVCLAELFPLPVLRHLSVSVQTVFQTVLSALFLILHHAALPGIPRLVVSPAVPALLPVFLVLQTVLFPSLLHPPHQTALFQIFWSVLPPASLWKYPMFLAAAAP